MSKSNPTVVPCPAASGCTAATSASVADKPGRSSALRQGAAATGAALLDHASTGIRRRLLLAAAAIPLAAPYLANAQAARTVRVGSLRLILSMTPHFYQRFAPPGLTIEIVNFDSPTDGKNAVVTRSVDFGGFGIAAATLGAAAGEPVVVIGAFGNRGMGVIARAGSGITNIAGLRGKRVGIWPGSTQEVFIRERLRQSGMTLGDITALRVPFGEMHAMLSRGDIDAYVGAEPGPALSITSGVGTLVEYPYGTAMGGLNMIFATNETLIAQDPALVRTMLGIHRRATEYMMANRPEVVETTVRLLGAPRAAVEHAFAADNIQFAWRLDEAVMGQARIYAQMMLEMRQIRRLPDFSRFLNPRFSNEIAAS